MSEQLKSSGWIAVIVEPSGTYFRKPAALAKSSESDKAADILEAQEKAYATARVADTEKEEAEKAAAPAGANAATDAPAAAPTSVSTVDAARRKGDGGGACHHCPPSADGLDGDQQPSFPDERDPQPRQTPGGRSRGHQSAPVG